MIDLLPIIAGKGKYKIGLFGFKTHKSGISIAKKKKIKKRILVEIISTKSSKEDNFCKAKLQLRIILERLNIKFQ
jgi:hypothetical protein